MTRAVLERVETALNADEQAFLNRARAKFLENMDWLEFENLAFGSRSPLFSKTRSHRDVLEHPLYLALKDMWLELGVKQGRISIGQRGEKDAARRKARGRG